MESVLVTPDLYSSEGEDSEVKDAPSTPVEEILASPQPRVMVERLQNSPGRKKEKEKRSINKGQKKIKKQSQMEKKIRKRRSRMIISSDSEECPEDTVPDLLVDLPISSEVQVHLQEREEEDELEPPEQKSSRAQEELQAVIETQEGEEATQPPPPFLPISVINVEEQEPLEWDKPKETRASSIQQRRQQNSGQERAPIRVTIPISKLPRIPRVKSPITAIPARYDTDRKRERKEEQEKRAVTGKRRR